MCVIDFWVPATHIEQMLTLQYVYCRSLFFCFLVFCFLFFKEYPVNHPPLQYVSPFCLPKIITVLTFSSVLPTWVFYPLKRLQAALAFRKVDISTQKVVITVLEAWQLSCPSCS